ncbi:MAG: hypothetical protein JW821_04335 [Deltaproteobacteria bacterium]|nr:hypothetical protein [Deltaproteobacteria bacterium]
MPILFTQYWDIMPGRFDDYAAFVTNEYIPAFQKLGIRLAGGYYVVVGEGPRIVAVAEAENVNSLQRSLSTKDYRILTNRLFQYVWKYGSKIWVPSGRIQEGTYHIQTGVWRYNQYYNVLPGKEEAHYRFVKDECIPKMKELGIPITSGWRLVVGAGARTLAESTAMGIVDIAKAIDASQFRRLVKRLKNEFATDYSSRILVSTGRIEVPFLLAEMMKDF